MGLTTRPSGGEGRPLWHSREGDRYVDVDSGCAHFNSLFPLSSLPPKKKTIILLFQYYVCNRVCVPLSLSLLLIHVFIVHLYLFKVLSSF